VAELHIHLAAQPFDVRDMLPHKTRTSRAIHPMCSLIVRRNHDKRTVGLVFHTWWTC
jgi:hypothetical protein